MMSEGTAGREADVRAFLNLIVFILLIVFVALGIVAIDQHPGEKDISISHVRHRRLANKATAPAAVICMIRNEQDILQYWVRYHAAVFGLENLAVLDNFSDDNITISLLNKWEKRGLKVIRKQGTCRPPYKTLC